jgi:large subunit ribosomal protein L18
MAQYVRKAARRLVHARIRKTLAGSPERPRLAVHFSQQNVYAQVIDDSVSFTLVAASTAEKSASSKGANITSAVAVGKLIAERAKAKNIDTVVFDRGGHRFHGKVKALADAAREAGLKF